VAYDGRASGAIGRVTDAHARRFIATARALDGVVFRRLDRVVERWLTTESLPA
jgi:hypothetical protein